MIQHWKQYKPLLPELQKCIPGQQSTLVCSVIPSTVMSYHNLWKMRSSPCLWKLLTFVTTPLLPVTWKYFFKRLLWIHLIHSDISHSILKVFVLNLPQRNYPLLCHEQKSQLLFLHIFSFMAVYQYSFQLWFFAHFSTFTVAIVCPLAHNV